MIPRHANKPCGCGAKLRVACDVDGNRVLLDAAPTAAGNFVMVVAWDGSGVYVGEPEPGEYVAPSERFSRHIHATGVVDRRAA